MATKGTARDDGGNRLLVLDKISRILDAFTLDEPELTLQQIGSKAGLAASTTQRLVQNLTRERYLHREGNMYSVGVRVLRWASAGTAALDITERIRPALRDLRDQTGETACFYVRDGLWRVVVAVAHTRHVVIRPFAVGQVMPVYAGAAARVFVAHDEELRLELKDADLARYTDATPTSLDVLLADVDRVKDLGYASAFSERHEGVGSISSPVFGFDGGLVGVLGIGFPNERVGPNNVDELGPLVARAATAASSALGYRAQNTELNDALD
ncbi:IclR family transcriptional regulator [Schaalia vaccimaxillae]|uniref:IclR family transcriptional regulator n=1 Tax=Schaalia vaccimaxillae TaxID=183916 RepID=UPI0003B7AE88|nr:IclR family transcriptional regulator [Schaalia vaccimaxillae]